MTESREGPYALFWVDIESTGLEPTVDDILEIAYGITEFAYPYRVTVPFTRRLVNGRGRERLLLGSFCNARVQQMHVKSGLCDELRDETNPLLQTLEAIEAELLALSAEWPGVDIDMDALHLWSPDAARALRGRKVRTAGCSVKFDYNFLRVHMPKFASKLSYKGFDVSAAHEFLLSLGKPDTEPPGVAHRALDDITYAIDLARRSGEWVRNLPAEATVPAMTVFGPRPVEPSGKNHCGEEELCGQDCYSEDCCQCHCGSRCDPWNEYRDALARWEAKQRRVGGVM